MFDTPLAGSVGGIVVNDQNMSFWQSLPYLLDKSWEVFDFVVSGNGDKGFWHERRVWLKINRTQIYLIIAEKIFLSIYEMIFYLVSFLCKK